MAQDEYGVYRDQEGNTWANDGRIINVSKADIVEIFESAESVGRHFLSLPHYV